MLSKEVSSTIFKVFGMTRSGIEPRSPGSLANTQPIRPMSRSILNFIDLSIIMERVINVLSLVSTVVLFGLLRISTFSYGDLGSIKYPRPTLSRIASTC